MTKGAQREYTSSTAKLLHHLDRLEQIQKHGRFKPIMLELAPTNKCNLNCVFCSVANRDQTKQLSLSMMVETAETFQDLGLLSVEITGGGDPLCHPEIGRLIELLDDMGLNLALITNGLRLNKALSQEQLKRLEWIRISLNTLDYHPDLRLEIPKGPTLGFSYVWNRLSTREKLETVSHYAEKYDAQYVRVVPDCLSAQRIDRTRREIAPLTKQFPRFFFSMKGYDKPEECWLGYLRPFLNADGYIYRCSANPLIERRFHPDFRICHHTQVREYWRQRVKPFYTQNCGLCFFKPQNELISQLIHPVSHPNFV